MLMGCHGVSDLLMRVVRLFMPVAAILTDSSWMLPTRQERVDRACLVQLFSWMSNVIIVAMSFEKHDCLRRWKMTDGGES